MNYDSNDLLSEIESFLESRIAFFVKLVDGRKLTWDEWEEIGCPKDLYLGVECDNCHHTFSNVVEFLKQKRMDDKKIESLLNELRSRDGYCDCTVLIRLIKANREAR